MGQFGIPLSEYNNRHIVPHYNEDETHVDCNEFRHTVAQTRNDAWHTNSPAQQQRILAFVTHNINHVSFQKIPGSADGDISAMDLDTFIHDQAQLYRDDPFLSTTLAGDHAPKIDGHISFNELDILYHIVVNDHYNAPYPVKGMKVYAHMPAKQFETLWDDDFGQERATYGLPTPELNPDLPELGQAIQALPEGLRPTTILTAWSDQAKPLGELLISVMAQQNQGGDVAAHQVQIHPRPFAALNRSLDTGDFDFGTLEALYRLQSQILSLEASGQTETAQSLLPQREALASQTPLIPAGTRVRLGVRVADSARPRQDD